MTETLTAPASETPAAARGQRKERIGLVVSDKMAKTIIVAVERRVKHPLYKKYVRRFTRLYAHDERNEARTGDSVEVVACRPISRLKRWRLARVLRAAEVSSTQPLPAETRP